MRQLPEEGRRDVSKIATWSYTKKGYGSDTVVEYINIRTKVQMFGNIVDIVAPKQKDRMLTYDKKTELLGQRNNMTSRTRRQAKRFFKENEKWRCLARFGVICSPGEPNKSKATRRVLARLLHEALEHNAEVIVLT